MPVLLLIGQAGQAGKGSLCVIAPSGMIHFLFVVTGSTLLAFSLASESGKSLDGRLGEGGREGEGLQLSMGVGSPAKFEVAL